MAGLTTLLSSISKKDNDLFVIELAGLEIVFSLPSVKQAMQYRMLLSFSDSESETMLIHEHIFAKHVQDKSTVVHNKDMPAGIPESIAKTILLLSGANDNANAYTEEMFNVVREISNSNLSFMRRTICSIFPGYTFEALDHLNYQQLVSNFIQAEQVMIAQGLIETPFSLVEQKTSQKPHISGINDMIEQDTKAYRSFDNQGADPIDFNRKEQIDKIRAAAKEQAEAQEREYFRQHPH
jgi:type II secretory pathway component GspD/PulD (secretin)